MDSFDNPEQFQNSSIVQKSSKTGIFSNKRLLVIKNGYLYYFSKVPKGYKSHVPNILTTFTDLPKSSIEIKNILDIRLESTKSSNLIIKFYLRDMIDRQDIRKSIDTHSYMLPQKKGNTDFDEWKFMFTTVLQCRLWFNALIKLKDYFKNLDIKFEKFVSNFDKRNSLIIDSKDTRSQSQLKLPISSNLLLSNTSIELERSQKPRKTQPINFDASKFIGSVPQKQLSPVNNKNEIEQKADIPLKITIQETKMQKLMANSQAISEEDEESQNGYPPEITQTKQSELRQIHNEPVKTVQPFKSRLKQSHLIQPINQDEQIKIRQLQQQIREQLKHQLQKKLRQEMQNKLKQQLQKQKNLQINRIKAEVQMKEMKIKQLQTEIHIKHLANMEKQKLIEQEKKQLQNKIYQEQQKLKQYQITVQNQIKQQNKYQHISKQQSKILSHTKQIAQTANKNKLTEPGDEYEMKTQVLNHTGTVITQNDNTKPSFVSQNHIEVHQFSVQTDDQQFNNNNSTDQFEPHFNFSKEISISKDLNLSKQTKIRNSFFSDYLTSNRNTILSERYRIEEDILPSDQQQEKQEFSKYNYFLELEKIFQVGVPSNQKIQREIKLLRYINFIKNQIVKTSCQYIKKKRPKECVSFEKGLLSFEIACAPGKMINIEGQRKLIYSNKVHENLKRNFKIYQKLQNHILKILKSKKSFPIRVPLCTLVQFQGYTILGKLQICCHQEDIVQKEKYLKYILPQQFNSYVSLLKTIQINDENQYFMIKVVKPFKLLNEKRSKIKSTEGNLHLIFGRIMKARSQNVSISYQSLLQQVQNDFDDQNKSQNAQSQEKKQTKSWILRKIKLIRELKKIFKSIEPYSQNQSQQNQMKSQFVQTLIKKPQDFLSLISSQTEFKLKDLESGFFWALLEFFLGVRMFSPIKQGQQDPHYQLTPVVRTFSLKYLLSTQYCEKIDKYLSMNNVDSAQNCSKLFKKISFNQQESILAEIKVLLKKKQYGLVEQKIYYLRQNLSVHDLRNIEINAYLIQCYIFMGLETEALKQIKSSLEYIQYMFGSTKNSYEQNLHLLMAETLLKMGNVKDAITFYKSLLKFDKIQKQQILISLAQSLVKENSIDNSQAIPFLTQCLEEVQILEHKIQLLLCISKLYLKSQRKDKCIFYLQKAYELGISSKSYNKILQIYEILMNNMGNQGGKKKLYQDFLRRMQSKFLNRFQNCKYFNTINLYQLIIQHEEIDLEQIGQVLERIKIEMDKQLKFNVEIKIWQVLKSFVISIENIRISEIEKSIKAFSNTLESIDLQKLIALLKNTQVNQEN